MSHFSVMVIGDNYKHQLEPYQELDSSEKPRWDWYELGGRWTGFFKVRSNALYPEFVRTGAPGILADSAKPGYADQLMKCDIDIETMHRDKKEQAEREYDKVEAITKDCPKAMTWSQVKELHSEGDEARTIYHSQPFVVALREAKIASMWGDVVESYGIDRNKFVQLAVSKVLVPFAVVWEGVWYERGEMGWFGSVADEKPQEEWNKEFFEMFSSLGSKTLVTIVDCHI